MRAPIGWRRAESLAPTEAAAIIRDKTGQPCSRSLFYEWVHSRRIPTHTDCQNRLRIRTADLVEFMATLTAEAQDQCALFDLPDGGANRVE